jgi:hypothetical protein
MVLLTSIVDIDSIQVKNPPFTPEQHATQVEALANTIVDLGGVLNLPVVRQVSIDDYELISGHLEYYAYTKAHKINPHLPDRMTVFVADTKNQAEIYQQLEILQAVEATQPNSSQPTSANQSALDLQLKNFEVAISKDRKAMAEALDKLKTELISAFEARLPKPVPPLPPLDAFNRIAEPEIALLVQQKLAILGPGKVKKVMLRLQEVSKQKNHQPFRSFADVVEALKEQQPKKSVKLISEAKMLEIIDHWNNR